MQNYISYISVIQYVLQYVLSWKLPKNIDEKKINFEKLYTKKEHLQKIGKLTDNYR